jgi:hypothetical protein
MYSPGLMAVIGAAGDWFGDCDELFEGFVAARCVAASAGLFTLSLTTDETLVTSGAGSG